MTDEDIRRITEAVLRDVPGVVQMHISEWNHFRTRIETILRDYQVEQDRRVR